MKKILLCLQCGLLAALVSGCMSSASHQVEARPLGALNLKQAEVEIETRYAKAHPEVQEYIRWTARTFGPGGFWFNENALAALPDAARNARLQHLAILLVEGEYGRHLCVGLAEAGAFKDPRLLPGLLKVAGYHLDDRDYDCRPKWMAVAALARQESDEAVPLLISLVDHGNQNTRLWARAALSRKLEQDFKQDKQAWAACWQARGNLPLNAKLLKPWAPPPQHQP